MSKGDNLFNICCRLGSLERTQLLRDRLACKKFIGEHSLTPLEEAEEKEAGLGKRESWAMR